MTGPREPYRPIGENPDPRDPHPARDERPMRHADDDDPPPDSAAPDD